MALLLGAAMAEPEARAADYKTPQSLPGHGTAFGALRPDAKAGRPDITVTTDRYSFDDATPRTVMPNLRAAAQRAGLAKLGRTDWNVKWRYKYTRRNGFCAVSDVTTSLKVRYQMPEWKPASQPSNALRKRWTSFSTGLDVHEYGHALIGYHAMQEIQQGLSSSSFTHKDCDRVGEALNAQGRAIIQTAKNRGRAYDDATDYGRSQGAYFSTRGLK